MPRPSVGSYTEKMYAAFAPVATDDEKIGWHLLIYLGALGGMLQEIEDYVRDNPVTGRPGWSVIVDADTVPDKGLDWLGQFIGAVMEAGMTPAQKRARIKNVPGWSRGTLTALTAAAQETLTGTKRVLFFERASSAYTITVQTHPAETPDATKTNKVLQALKPAGIILTHIVQANQTFITLRDVPASRTFQQVKDTYATFQAVRDAVP